MAERRRWRICERSLPKVFADTERIVQVMTNLFSNAVKFTKGDGVIELILEERDGVVAISVKHECPFNYALLYITDLEGAQAVVEKIRSVSPVEFKANVAIYPIAGTDIQTLLMKVDSTVQAEMAGATGRGMS